MKQTRVGLVRRYVRRSMRLLPALVILLSLGLAGLAPADAAGTGVADAVAPSGEWKSLAAGLSGRLVFQTAYGGPLYTIDADGGNLQRLTNGIDPAWSPDGS